MGSGCGVAFLISGPMDEALPRELSPPWSGRLMSFLVSGGFSPLCQVTFPWA